MASANKKFLLNLTSTRSYFKKRFTGSQESLNVDGSRRPSQLNASPMLLSAGGGFRPCLLPDNSNLLRSSSATDVMAETEAEAQNEVDDLPALTQNIRQLIQALSILKNTISSMSDLSKDAVQSEAHEKLEIVLNVMKMTLNRFPSLRSADILNAVQTLIKKVEGCEFDGSSHCKDEIYDVIDSLALVISNSVSDCLTVSTNCENISNLPKTKSLTCLTPAANGTNSKQSDQTKDDGRRNHEQDVLGGDVLDDSILYKLESGVEIALLRAQTWSKYTKELVSYVERRINLWGDFSRSLLKLAKSVEQSISEDTFLPLQSLFCTALTQDIELASMSQAARTLILNQTFVTTLNQRRTEHDKVRKNLKYVWTKQVRKLHDSIANLRKAKESYISRQQDYKKIRELALKAENESMSLSATGGVNAAKADAKVEKKKKQEDEAMQKAIEAETFYKQCVRDANEQQKQLEQVKCQVLHATKELLIRSDAVLKETTSGYFKLMNTIMETIPHQFQTLHYSSELYEEGSHYLEYVNQLQASEYALAQVHTFVFEPYAINVKSSDPNDTQNDSVHSHQELSKTHSSGLSKGEDSDSMSGGSSMSLESSPTTSPYQHNRRKIITSSSMAELMAQAGDDEHTKHDDETPATFRGVRLSLDAQSHSLRKLRAPSKCAHCDNIIYMQGAECEKCGIASHKKCLEILRLSCSDQHDSARAGVVGLPLDPAIQEVPFIVTKCIQEIDRRGLNIKGIYRISGVKSRVEQVCQSFEVEEGNIDLSDQPPNVIANVLKLYLRQLPEPLLTFRLYLDFVQLAKDEVHGSGLGQILSSLSQLIEQLPPAHHKTCNILMYHLNRVAKNHEVNQMSATNLGIVFGPTLLKPKDGAASLNYLIETPYQTRIIELLIQNVQAIFGPDEGTTVDDSGDIRRKKSPLKSENSSEFTSPGYASWYAPDTLDLLEELAKEEPHFLSLHSLSSDLPVIAAAHHTEETNESRETEDKSKASNEKVFFT